MFNTDPNGEPLLEDVLSYMKRQTYFADPLTAQDIKDVRDFLLSTHYFSMRLHCLMLFSSIFM